MPVSWSFRLALLALIAFLAVPAATVNAAPRMPVGFFDDPSFRWSPAAYQNMRQAFNAHASIIHVLADWSQIAPEKPKNPLNGSDPAYNLTDLDFLVRTAPRWDQEVLMTISGTPRWANGGQTPNHPPKNLADLTAFAHMLAARYNGHRAGFGAVTRWSVWNEPNLYLFLAPQFNSSGKIVSAKTYVKLWMAAYTGIKAGNASAEVAAGDTSNRGHNHPTGGVTDSVAPATFAKLVSRASPNMPFVAWAEHPYPSIPNPSANQKATYPEVRLTNINKFGASLEQWFHRRVPIWVTEWGEQTAPEYPHGGVSYAQQARDVTTALQLAQASPYVEMFIWFIFRDSNNETWFSGLQKKTGVKKPAYSAFVAAAKNVVGQTVPVAPNRAFTVKLHAPLFTEFDAPGSKVHVTYFVYKGRGLAAYGQKNALTHANQIVTFKVDFKPAKGVTYTMKVDVGDRHGYHEKRTVALVPPYN
jgi:hypothetical protein